ncbi:MAG: thiolase family protein [Erysipelotrichaceae bacterium]|nr:thiolase family protein [Erysipelotrichaceae bacterium]
MYHINKTEIHPYKRSVSIIGVGCTPFMNTIDNPETNGLTEGELFGYAGLQAMEDAGVRPKDVDFYYHGCASPLNGSNYLTPNMQVAEWVGMRGKASIHHSEACCTGYLGLELAANAIASGKYDCVLTGAVEYGDGLAIQGLPSIYRKKFSFQEFQISTEWLTDNAYTRHLLCNIGHDNSALWYQTQYGLTDDEIDKALCQLAVIARRNTVNNPLAIIHKTYDEDAKEAGFDNVLDYMQSAFNPKVGGIMRISGLEQKCDGAAAVLLCATEKVEELTHGKVKPIEVLGIGCAALEASNPYLEVYGTMEADRQVKARTGIDPSEIDLLYANDFIIGSQLIAADISGYIPKGEGWKYVMDGRTGKDGDKPINPNGGRTAFGHAHAASGLADVYDAVKQMRGLAGDHQVKKTVNTTYLRGFGGGQNLCDIIIRNKD